MSYKTYQEYLQHPKYKVVRNERMLFAKGLCEICNSLATEVHHRRYPKWGTFDVMSNIIAVCHHCHCKIHNKDN